MSLRKLRNLINKYMNVLIKRSDVESLCSTHSPKEMAEALSALKGVVISEKTTRDALRHYKLSAKTQRISVVFENEEMEEEKSDVNSREEVNY